MNRLAEIRKVLLEDGVPVRRADQIVSRYRTLTKKRRIRRKLEPIHRERSAVKKARSELAKKLKALFDKERPKIAAQISQLIARTAKADEDRVDTILNEIPFDGWVTLIVDGERILVHITVDGAGQAFTQLGADASSEMTDQVNQAALEWARERSAELVGMKYLEDGSLVENPNAIWAITESTREMLRADIADAIEQGLSTSEFADKLAESYAFSDARAEAIARTEIANADIQGSLIGWKESGMVEGKEVLLGSEHDVPDECDDAADYGVDSLDGDFGGLGDPPYHVSCVCDLAPVLAGEGEAEG